MAWLLTGVGLNTIVPVTPLLPRKGYGSATESSPSTSGCKGAGLGPQALDVVGASHTEGLGSRRRRAAGRKKTTVNNDEEDGTQASIYDDDVISVTSADEDSSMASSSGVSRRKGTKRIRDGRKDKDGELGSKEKVGEEDQESKKREGKGRETPEEERDGPSGEPKGVVGHVFENMSSAILGGAMAEWADQTEEMRKKSKNLHGKISGAIKNLLVKIKEGTALLVVRFEAVGDPHFLRMRNTELTTRMKEVEKENAWLKDQVRKSTPGADSPSRKKKVEKRMTAATSVGAENAAAMRETAPINAERGEFPPLPQRIPRNRTREVMVQRAPPPAVHRYTDTEDMEAESRFTQQINLLLAARSLERDRRRKEGQKRMRTSGQDNRNRMKERKRTEEVNEGNRKMGPRIISDMQVVLPSETFPMEGVPTPVMSASEAEWKVATGGRRRRNKEGRAMLPPPHRWPNSFGAADW